MLAVPSITPLPTARRDRASPAVYPLAPFAGERPPAPAWFTDALLVEPRRRWINVEGARIETLAWGDPHAPGLLLMHGQSAHAGWWRHIAPFLAEGRQVVAFSWSGMGRSDWRERYSTAIMEREAMAVMEAFGFFRHAVRPTIVGHSLGGLPTLGLATSHAEAFEGAIAIDTSVSSRRLPSDPDATHSSRVYPTLAAALARFRFVNSTGTERAYVADMFARDGLAKVPDADGGPGWRWTFDPNARSRFDKRKVAIEEVGCPLSLIYGADSLVVTPEARRAAIAAAPAETRSVVIPRCGHHVMAEEPLALIAALQAFCA